MNVVTCCIGKPNLAVYNFFYNILFPTKKLKNNAATLYISLLFSYLESNVMHKTYTAWISKSKLILLYYQMQTEVEKKNNGNPSNSLAKNE